MKTIEQLVGEVKKNLGASEAPKKHEVSAEKIPTGLCPEITLSIAKELACAVETAAKNMGVNVVTAVSDKGANLILLHAMDDSFIASIKAAQDKAYTAVALKMPTHEALAQSRGGTLDGLTNGNGIMLLGGGYPLRINGKIYGGIGVSGGTKDEDTVLAAVAAKYFETRFKGGVKG